MEFKNYIKKQIVEMLRELLIFDMLCDIAQIPQEEGRVYE